MVATLVMVLGLEFKSPDFLFNVFMYLYMCLYVR